MGTRGRKARDALVREDPPTCLLQQAPAAFRDDDACRCLQQDAVLARDLFGIAHEYAARPVDRVRLGAGRNQADDLVLEPLAIADVLLVPDHEIDDQALQAPVAWQRISCRASSI